MDAKDPRQLSDVGAWVLLPHCLDVEPWPWRPLLGPAPPPRLTSGLVGPQADVSAEELAQVMIGRSRDNLEALRRGADKDGVGPCLPDLLTVSGLGFEEWISLDCLFWLEMRGTPREEGICLNGLFDGVLEATARTGGP